MKVDVVSTSGNSFPYHGPIIRARTRGKANHSLIRFTIETKADFEFLMTLLRDAGVPYRKLVYRPGMMVYFESFWKKDKVTGRTGVRGPIPWQNIVDWEQERKSNKYYIQNLPFDQATIRRGMEFCVAHVGKVSYPYYQLLQSLLGVYWKHGESQAFCSEFAAMVLAVMCWAAMKYVLRDGHVAIDHVTPSGPDTGLDSGLENFQKR